MVASSLLFRRCTMQGNIRIKDWSEMRNRAAIIIACQRFEPIRRWTIPPFYSLKCVEHWLSQGVNECAPVVNSHALMFIFAFHNFQGEYCMIKGCSIAKFLFYPSFSCYFPLRISWFSLQTSFLRANYGGEWLIAIVFFSFRCPRRDAGALAKI